MTITASPSPSTLGGWIPATVAYGRAAGHTTNKVLFNPTLGLYGCNHPSGCTYTGFSYKTVFGHLGSHTQRRPKVKGTPQLDELAASVANVQRQVDRLKQVATAKKGVDPSWRTRALEAERRLASLRKALGQ